VPVGLQAEVLVIEGFVTSRPTRLSKGHTGTCYISIGSGYNEVLQECQKQVSMCPGIIPVTNNTAQSSGSPVLLLLVTLGLGTSFRQGIGASIGYGP
jgi:hypothetical protein